MELLIVNNMMKSPLKWSIHYQKKAKVFFQSSSVYVSGQVHIIKKVVKIIFLNVKNVITKLKNMPKNIKAQSF